MEDYPGSKEVYIGDAVYVRLEPDQMLRLRTSDSNEQIIYLDREVYIALVRFVDNLKGEA
jgi:hypothetical protein